MVITAVFRYVFPMVYLTPCENVCLLSMASFNYSDKWIRFVAPILAKA